MSASAVVLTRSIAARARAVVAAHGPPLHLVPDAAASEAEAAHAWAILLDELDRRSRGHWRRNAQAARNLGRKGGGHAVRK